jgi:hypothetical protein
MEATAIFVSAALRAALTKIAGVIQARSAVKPSESKKANQKICVILTAELSPGSTDIVANLHRTGRAIAEQPSLFSSAELQACTGLTDPDIFLHCDAIALTNWKQKIRHYQSQVQGSTIQQGQLFPDASELTSTIDLPDPFKLPQRNTNFWREKFFDEGVSALYFVIDYAAELLLYVGETVKSNQRWKGEHGCKHYLVNYQQAHYQAELPSQLGIAFWNNAPVATRARQKLELDLIELWRSPFNKENWQTWGTPFIPN